MNTTNKTPRTAGRNNYECKGCGKFSESYGYCAPCKGEVAREIAKCDAVDAAIVANGYESLKAE